MGILRSSPNTMARASAFRSYQLLLLLAAALAVVAFYYFGAERQSFSSTTRRLKETQASLNANRNDADLSSDTGAGHPDLYYHALMMFTKVDRNRGLQEKFRVALRSMAAHGGFADGEVLVLHFVSDAPSRELGERMLPELLRDATFRYEVVFHDVSTLTEKLFPIVEAMQKHFSAGSGAYYSDSIFFLSVAMHRIMPADLKQIVQLDLDLKYRSNIRELFQEFTRFPAGAVIGIAREMQPVYRHTFWQYRRENPKTAVGGPPPDGQPGFNSGVMLLDLEAMRRSALYNQLLEPARVARLADKYHFQGHLGDQDFFTMIGMEHPGLFHALDCGWNRQLCTWWREHGYGDVFQLYYQCDLPVRIYHGNCNTPIPDD
ncbi:xyloside xylosyltransferase 1 [Lepisosteus oculatus]|uniref:Xyloside xylosyltransferase 1 n=1 Tax=Lepisosteus oculatus TaxID=7918 RepID=W5MBY8_LEPOC|nr:PREDICTED: xyloside xylosyltransferase 1 isoform X2 [Lepisosteus oculatus]XP_015216703.1 PREDICTED: xyloside xylosyltransferase 1 isoform X2 [Lepisosteus oculatus]